MFGDKKLVVYFSRDKFQAALISGSGTTKAIQREAEQPWTKEDLSKHLLDLKKKFNEPFYVLVDDDLAFVLGITVPADIKEEKDFIRIKAAESIPEEVGDRGWDFKEMLQSKDGKDKVVQFALASSEFYKNLSRAAKDAGIKIEAMEPMVSSLARMRATKPDPEIIFYKAKGGERTIALFAYRGLVFFAESFTMEPASREVAKFLGFVKETTKFVPKTVFLSGDITTLNDKTPEFAGYVIEKGTLDPFAGVPPKPELNIELDATPASTESKLQNKTVGISEVAKNEGVGRYEPIGLGGEATEKYPQGKIFTYAIFLISLLVTVVNGIILYQGKQADEILNAPSDSIQQGSLSIPSVTASSSSPQSLDLKSYNVEVLNGSGKPGMAKTVADILTAKGFLVATVGTSNNPDATSTTVSYKASVPAEYRKAIGDALAIRYTIRDTGIELGPGEKVDVLVIVGKQ